MLEFQELRVFAAVIDAGGFLKASQVLHLTQPAVSQSIKNLEYKVGEKLVERSSPVRPTAIGYELLHHARFILERENEFIHDLAKLKKGHLQKLSLTVDYLVNEYHCASYVQATLAQLPDLTFKIKRLPAREMIQAVRTGQFDLGIGAFQKNMESLKTHKLFEETSYLVTGRSNPWFKSYKNSPLGFLKETVLLASYLDEPALRPSKTKIRDFFKAAWEIDNLSLQIKMLEEGIGATYIPETILKRDPVAKDFVVLEKIPFYRVSKPYGVYYREEAELSSAMQVFLEQCLQR